MSDWASRSREFQARWRVRSEFRSVLALYMQREEMTLEVAVELVDLAEMLMRGNEYTGTTLAATVIVFVAEKID